MILIIIAKKKGEKMIYNEFIPEYQCLGTAENGTKVYFHDSNIYIFISEKIDLSPLFFCHIWYDNNSNCMYRDFYYNNAERMNIDANKKVIKIRNIPENFDKIDLGQWNGEKNLWGYTFKKKNIAVFHTDHFGGGLSILVALKYLKHKDDITILICPEEKGNENRKNMLLELERKEIFDVVITSFASIPFYAYSQDINFIKEQVLRYYDQKLLFYGINIEHVNCIYTGTDNAGGFQLFLNLKKIKYIQYEFYENQFNDKWRGKNILKNGSCSEAYSILLNEYSVFNGESSLCEKWLFNPQTIKYRNEYNRPVEFINFVDEISHIPEKNLDCILTCAGTKRENFEENDLLLITNSKGIFADKFGKNVNIDENHIVYYLILLDYYGNVHENDKVLIKTHPDACFNFKYYIPESITIPECLPIEFVKGYPEIFFKRVVSIKTTSINKIQDRIGENIEAEKAYVGHYKDLHCLWAIFNIFNYNMNILQNGYEPLFFESCKNVLLKNRDRKTDLIEINNLQICNCKYEKYYKFNTFSNNKRDIIALINPESSTQNELINNKLYIEFIIKKIETEKIFLPKCKMKNFI